MSDLVFACFAVIASSTWVHPKAEPVQVCEAIEVISENQGVDPWLMAAIAWHESGFVVDKISPDGKDFGTMQVRVSIATGNPWIKGGKYCTRQTVLTTYGGVECGILMYLHAVDWYAFAVKNNRLPFQGWRPTSPMGCYAVGNTCVETHGVRAIYRMRQALLRTAGVEITED